MEKFNFKKIRDFFFYEVDSSSQSKDYKDALSEAKLLSEQGEKVVLLVEKHMNDKPYAHLCPPHPNLIVLWGREEQVINQDWICLQQLVLNQINQARMEYNSDLKVTRKVLHIKIEHRGMEYALADQKNNGVIILKLEKYNKFSSLVYLASGEFISPLFNKGFINRISKDGRSIWARVFTFSNIDEVEIKFTVCELELQPLKELTTGNLHLETVHYPILLSKEPHLR